MMKKFDSRAIAKRIVGKVRIVEDLSCHVGKLFIHTRKALRCASNSGGLLPNDPNRVFAVCGIFVDDDGRRWLHAWKCERLPNGKINHPAFKKPLRPNDPRLFSPKPGKNGAEPTATFRPDSHYMEMQ